MPYKFPHGHISATPNAIEAHGETAINECLGRHLEGDWGDVDPEDAKANEHALKCKGRLLSSYSLPTGKLWVITEWNRSATTILNPQDY